MEQNAITLQRDIETVTSEIIILKNQAQSMAIDFAIEIGGKLTEAKELVKHGEWGDWLKNKVDFSQSQANNLMKVYENRGKHNFLYSYQKHIREIHKLAQKTYHRQLLFDFN